MKESESVKEYDSKLMSIVNQRIVEKLLVSLLEIYEFKIFSPEDSK